MSVVQANLDVNAVRFMLRLLALSPPLLQNFSFRAEEHLEACPALRRHGAAVLKILGEAVAAGNQLDGSRAEKLAATGRRHLGKYKASPGDFEHVMEAVVWAVGDALGPYWTAELETAWRGGATKVMGAMGVFGAAAVAEH